MITLIITMKRGRIPYDIPSSKTLDTLLEKIVQPETEILELSEGYNEEILKLEKNNEETFIIAKDTWTYNKLLPKADCIIIILAHSQPITSNETTDRFPPISSDFHGDRNGNYELDGQTYSLMTYQRRYPERKIRRVTGTK